MLAMRGTGRARLLVSAVAAAALAGVVGRRGRWLRRTRRIRRVRQCFGRLRQCFGHGRLRPLPPELLRRRLLRRRRPPGRSVVPVPAAKAGQHQTSTRPPAHSAVFQAEMTDLWAAVVPRPSRSRHAGLLPAGRLQAGQGHLSTRQRTGGAASWRVQGRRDRRPRPARRRSARHATLVRVIVPEEEADWI